MAARAWLAGLFEAPRERFSVAEMAHLHAELAAPVTPANARQVVEALRALAELVIWGDQHDPAIVEYFLAHNLLAHFVRLLESEARRGGGVATQALQTLAILVQNVRAPSTLHCLFSGDHLNRVAALSLDLADEETLGYYVSLIRTISSRLDAATAPFFFREGGGGAAGGAGGGAAAFPLFTEAAKLCCHADGMVRAAARALTLNVFAVPLPPLRHFLATDPAATRLYGDLGAHAAGRCAALGALLAGWAPGDAGGVHAVEAALAEVEDLLAYCNDVLAARVAPLAALLLRALWARVVGPALLEPLARLGEGRPGSGGGGKGGGGAAGGALCALCVTERLLHAVTEPAVLALLAAALLGGPAAGAAAALAAGPLGGGVEPEFFLEAARCAPAAARAGFLAALRGGNGALAAAAARVVAALLGSAALPEAALEAAGLLPRRRRRAAAPEEDASDAVAAAAPTPMEALEEVLEVRSHPLGSPSPSPGTTPPASARGAGIEAAAGHYSPAADAWPPPSAGGALAAPTPDGDRRFAELVDALLALLRAKAAPPLALETAAWALRRLLAPAGGGAAPLAPSQRAALEGAVAARRAAFAALVPGAWSDALLPLGGRAWARARPAVLRTGAGSLHAAAATWAQAGLLRDLVWQLGGPAASPGAEAAAAAANARLGGELALARAGALAAALQAREALLGGGVAPGPPARAPAPAALAAREAADGAVIPLCGGGRPCAVAFAHGEERRVLLALAGAPPAGAPPEAPAALVLDLVAGGPGTAGAVVLSAAPLAGAAPLVDREQPRWLHVDVRPPASTLLRLVAAAPPGGEALALRGAARALATGHWVLAFPSEDEAREAGAAVRAAAAAARAAAEAALAPLLRDDDAAEAEDFGALAAAAPAPDGPAAAAPLESLLDQ
jgi:hypothetical protein